jgi:hypothetical protein
MDLADSIHGELRKPSRAAEKMRKTAANPRAKKPAAIRLEKRKIGAKTTPANSEAGPCKSLISGVLYGGAERDRTADLLVANEALSQLSYSPTVSLV